MYYKDVVVFAPPRGVEAKQLTQLCMSVDALSVGSLPVVRRSTILKKANAIENEEKPDELPRDCSDVDGHLRR
ncbi:hypothetical protein TNCV_552741 [Trichonephila clavipes]|nr:hypothetical protein TNCV_552741 [Trichonephila clavipes]